MTPLLPVHWYFAAVNYVKPVLDEKLFISGVDAASAPIITELGITTFVHAFGPVNNKADMDSYLASEMTLEKLTAEINDPLNTFLLACYEGVPVGFSKLREGINADAPIHGNCIELERLYVLPGHQGKRIGATLMEHCTLLAKNKGYDVMWLGVWEHNYRAQKLYLDLGFEFYSSHIFRLGTDDQTDLLMKKSL